MNIGGGEAKTEIRFAIIKRRMRSVSQTFICLITLLSLLHSIYVDLI